MELEKIINSGLILIFTGLIVYGINKQYTQIKEDIKKYKEENEVERLRNVGGL